jgi:YggT family protein
VPCWGIPRDPTSDSKLKISRFGPAVIQGRSAARTSPGSGAASIGETVAGDRLAVRAEGGVMFILGNLVGAMAHLLAIVLHLYMWAIIIRALLSWVSPDPSIPIVQILLRITEPVLSPIRRRLPIGGMGLDLSPMVAILAIYFLQAFVVNSLGELAWRFRSMG